VLPELVDGTGYGVNVVVVLVAGKLFDLGLEGRFPDPLVDVKLAAVDERADVVANVFAFVGDATDAYDADAVASQAGATLEVVHDGRGEVFLHVDTINPVPLQNVQNGLALSVEAFLFGHAGQAFDVVKVGVTVLAAHRDGDNAVVMVTGSVGWIPVGGDVA
jgi:hypothetical protein